MVAHRTRLRRTAELSDAGGPLRTNWQLTRPTRIRCSDLAVISIWPGSDSPIRVWHHSADDIGRLLKHRRKKPRSYRCASPLLQGAPQLRIGLARPAMEQR